MNGVEHRAITEAVARRIFTDDAAKVIGKFASFPDEVEDIAVEGVGTHIAGRSFSPLTHFCVPYGQTFRGYAWHMDPSLPYLDLPNRKVIVDASAWLDIFLDIPQAKHPVAILLGTPGYTQFADEFTFSTGAAMASWIGTTQKPSLAAAGASCHFVQDACIREHCTGSLLGRHSVREAESETWWFKHSTEKRVVAMLDTAKLAGPQYPRAAVEECAVATRARRDPCLRPCSDAQMVALHERAILYTARLLWWWAERGVA